MLQRELLRRQVADGRVAPFAVKKPFNIEEDSVVALSYQHPVALLLYTAQAPQ
jgi:hypothetical protein